MAGEYFRYDLFVVVVSVIRNHFDRWVRAIGLIMAAAAVSFRKLGLIKWCNAPKARQKRRAGAVAAFGT